MWQQKRGVALCHKYKERWQSLCFPVCNSSVNGIKEAVTSANKGASSIIKWWQSGTFMETTLVPLILLINCKQFGTGLVFPSYTQHWAQTGATTGTLCFCSSTDNKTRQKKLQMSSFFFLFFFFPVYFLEEVLYFAFKGPQLNKRFPDVPWPQKLIMHPEERTWDGIGNNTTSSILMVEMTQKVTALGDISQAWAFFFYCFFFFLAQMFHFYFLKYN